MPIPAAHVDTLRKAAASLGVELGDEPLSDWCIAHGLYEARILKHGCDIRLTFPVATLDDITMTIAELQPWAPGAVHTAPVEIVKTTPIPKVRGVAAQWPTETPRR